MEHAGAQEGTILVAEDNEAARNLYALILREQGFDVFVAADGVEALEILTNEPIDAGLIDVMMPRHNGYDVCRIAKAHPRTRSIPMALITGLVDDSDSARGTEVGADDFIRKPVERDDLINRLKTLVKLKRLTDQLEQVESALFALALSAEPREPGMEAHSERVARISAALGERLGMPASECESLRRAGYLHDIGKILIPDAILLKAGTLDEQEWRQIESHPERGVRLCSPVLSLQDVLPVIRWHHERLDGGGYPDHLRGDEIPLPVRIVQIADIYDALVNARPYRPALTSQAAIATIRYEVNQGWWDGSVLDELEGLLSSPHTLPEMHPPIKAWLPRTLRKAV